MCSRHTWRAVVLVVMLLQLAGCAVISFPKPRYKIYPNSLRQTICFCNRRERCIHANPVYDDIAPGQTASASSHIRIMRGGVNDFARAADVPAHKVTASTGGR